MPSIAALIKELLSEDKYSSNFTDKIEDRVKELNAAQLQGIYGHLLASAKASKTALWRGANEELMSRIQGELQIKTKQAQSEFKVIEEYRFQQKQKRDKLKMAKKEQIRVREMIEAKARKQAEDEVKEKEYQRQSEERMVIMKRVFEAEELRNTWWKRLAVMYLLLIGSIIAAISIILKLAIYFTIAGVFVVTVLFVYLAYYCHTWTIIKPIQIPPEIIEAQIEQRGETLRKEAFSIIREKERKFQEQEKLDKIERKKRKKQRKEQEQLQAHMMEQARLERIAMAKEIRERSSQGGGSSIAGSKAGSIQGSLAASIEGNKQSQRPSLPTFTEEDQKQIENMVIDLENSSPEKDQHPEVDDDDDDDEDDDYFDGDEIFEGSDVNLGDDHLDSLEHGDSKKTNQKDDSHLKDHEGVVRSPPAFDLEEGKLPHEDDVISIFTSSVADDPNYDEFNKIYRNVYLDPNEVDKDAPVPLLPQRSISLIAEKDDDLPPMLQEADLEKGNQGRRSNNNSSRRIFPSG